MLDGIIINSYMWRMSILADQMGFEVTYHGVSGVGQHMFANGELVVTDVFNTLDEAVTRFGKRIDTKKKEFFYALMYMEGHATAKSHRPYRPMLKDAQSLKEYGLGYVQGIYDRQVKEAVAVPVVEAPPPPAVVAPPVKAPEEVVAPAPKKKAVKRRKKRKTKPKAKKPKQDIMDID